MPDLPTVESLTIPAGPFLPVLTVPDVEVDVDLMDAAMRLSDRIREHAPNALPLIVLGDAQLTMLGDPELAELGLVRIDRVEQEFPGIPRMQERFRDTPPTGVDEIPD